MEVEFRCGPSKFIPLAQLYLFTGARGIALLIISFILSSSSFVFFFVFFFFFAICSICSCIHYPYSSLVTFSFSSSFPSLLASFLSGTRSQSLLCEGDTFTAECASGQRIVVFDGYFGMLEKEKSSLISLGSLQASTSCERFARRLQEKRKEVMMMQKYSLDQDGSLVDSQGRPVDPWFQLTTCRTTAVKSFLMNQCHGRRSCTFDVTKETLWHPDLLANCKRSSGDFSRVQMNRLKVEYTCADHSIFSTVPASLSTPANDVTDRHLSTVPILIGGSTAPAQDYPYVPLTPKPTTLMWPSRVRTTSSKPFIPAEAMFNKTADSTGVNVASGEEKDDEDDGYSNNPTIATVSLDTDSSEESASSDGDVQVGAITIISEASNVRDKGNLDTSSGQGAMRTSSSLPSLTEIPGNTSPSDTGLANCTIPPVTGDVTDADRVGRSLFIIPVNNLLSAYSFIIRNLEKFILYILLALLASLLAVLMLLTCRLYFSKRNIVRRHKKIAHSSSPSSSSRAVNVLMNQVDHADEDDDDDDDDDDTHNQLTPSPDTRHYSSHRTHHRFSSPTTVDGNTTVASNASLRSHSGNSTGGSLGVRLKAAGPVDNLTHSSPNLTPRAVTSTPSCRSEKFISPAARIYFENHCKIHGASSVSRNRSGLADSGASLGQGDDTDVHTPRASPITPQNECDDSPNLLVGSYRTGIRDVNSSGDSGNSIAADHESPPSSDNHAALECHLHFADDERYLNESTTSDLPATRGPEGARIEVERDQVKSLVPGQQPSQYFLRTFSRHRQSAHSPYSSPFVSHQLNAYPTGAVSSSTGARSLVAVQSCTSESTPLLPQVDAASSANATGSPSSSSSHCSPAAASFSPDGSLPIRHSVLHSYSFVHHPHHLNHHQHPNTDYYAYRQTRM